MCACLRKDLGFVVFLLCIIKCLTVEPQITFETYCSSDKNPKDIPSDGKSSSGFLCMQDVIPGLNCSVTLNAIPRHQLLLTFSLISLRNSSLDSLTVIYNNSNNVSAPLAGLKTCITENCTDLMFESGRGYPGLTLNFLSANSSIPKNATGFRGVFTVFDYTDSQGECHGENQFACNNKHCIWNGLVCNGHNNCGDRSDEASCDASVKDTIWGIVVVAIGVVSLLILVPVFCFLAVYGTKSSVKSLTVSQLPTPMYPTLNDGETANLLTSSEIPPLSDSEEESDSSKHSMNYGTDSKPSTSQATKIFGSYFTEAITNEKFS